MKNLAFAMIAGSILSGCVAKKKFLELESQQTSCSAQVDQLEAELADCKVKNATLTSERDALMGDRAQLGSSLAQMEQALSGLKVREAAAQARVAAYQDMLQRFKKMIDAGTLKVKIVDGRMVVELATDVLFASGKAELSPKGAAAIQEVAAVLASIPDRKFQVEGHTDNVPISTAQYPSNWVLASARAITVVESMMAAGLSSDKVSAASFADTRPVSPNDTAEGRTANRRIEIVILPDLSGLPGFQELQSISR